MNHIYQRYLRQCSELGVEPSILGWCLYFDAWAYGYEG